MSEEDKKPPLKDEKVIGNGSFGVVFQATMADTGDVVAVKKVLQDKRFKVSSPAGVMAVLRVERVSCVQQADHDMAGHVCAEPRAADHEAIEAQQCCRAQVQLLLQG